jgi:hypothetical protein
MAIGGFGWIVEDAKLVANLRICIASVAVTLPKHALLSHILAGP